MTLQGRHISVATPMYNNMCIGDFVTSLIRLQGRLHEVGARMSFLHCNGTDIALARNIAAGAFMQSEATDLLFVDADMGFDADEVIAMLETGHDVVGAVCPNKFFDWNRVKAIAAANPDIDPGRLERASPAYGTLRLVSGEGSGKLALNAPFEVAGIGTGIMAIKRDVFAKLYDAFPDQRISMAANPTYISMFAPGTKDIGAPFRFRVDNGEIIGEDIGFCADWRSIGGKVWACPWLTIRHTGNYSFTGSLRAIAESGGTVHLFSEAPPAR